MSTFTRYSDSLLLLPAAGIAAGLLKPSALLVFALNLLSFTVLLGWIMRSVDSISINSTRLVNEFIKAILGNAVELMTAISSVTLGRAYISRYIFLGSILCNLLLVLGSSIFFAGYGKNRLRFDRTLTTTLSSLMMVVFIMLIVPTAMETLSSHQAISTTDTQLIQHTTVIILMILLAIYLMFRLLTHAEMFASTPFHYSGSDSQVSHTTMDSQTWQPLSGSRKSALILVVASSTMLACSFPLVNSIDGTAKALGTNPPFLGITMVPLLDNLTKYHRIVKGSSNEQIERGIRAIINGILRLTVLLAPLLAMIGWAFGQPLILKFDEFEATSLLLSIVVMTYLISYGRSNYFEGLMLIGTYIIMAFSFYVRPDSSIKVVPVSSPAYYSERAQI